MIRNCLLGGILSLFFPASAIAANLMQEVENVFLSTCLSPMEQGIEISGNGLIAQDNGEETKNGKYLSFTWAHPKLPVTLLQIRSLKENPNWTGCQLLPSNTITSPKELEGFRAFAERWAKSALETGQYRELPVCEPDKFSFQRLLESTYKRPNGQFLRVDFAQTSDVNYFVLSASETAQPFSKCE